MAARLLPGLAVQIRRGRRHDLPGVEAVLGGRPPGAFERLYRRIVADLGADLYVAEDARGEIVGLVSLVYAHSLTGGLSAWLDGAHALEPPSRGLLEALVAFAEERARRRGCRRLTACFDREHPELRATLLARGYRAGEMLVADLTRAGGGTAA